MNQGREAATTAHSSRTTRPPPERALPAVRDRAREQLVDGVCRVAGRVVDTDRTAGNQALDEVSFDRLFVRSVP